jgi:hypothetical protein
LEYIQAFGFVQSKDYIPSEAEVCVMARYIFALLWQGLGLTVTHMGTTAFALFFGWARNVQQYRSRAMTQQARQDWWKEVKPGVQITMGIWFLLFVYCVFEASYTNFHAVDSERQQLVGDNQQLQKKFNELTVPVISGGIYHIAMAPVGPNNSQFICTITAWANNRGAPTVLVDWRSNLKLKNGKVVEGKVIQPPFPGNKVTMYFGPKNEHKMFLVEPEHLAVQTVSHPIPQGGGVGGWIMFLFPVSAEEARDGLVTLFFRDVTYHEWSFPAEVSNVVAPPLTLGDLKQQ